MRVLRLDLGRTRVELHPFVTVVRGLGPEVRARLLDVLAGLPEGRTPVGGLIEAHGVLLDLAPATLGLLDLEQRLDVVVRAGDLPASDNGDDPARSLRRQVAEAERAVTAAHAALRDAERRHEAALAALEVGVDADVDLSTLGDLEGEAGAHTAAAMARAEAARDVEAAAAELQVAITALEAAEAAANDARGARADAASAVGVAVAALEGANARRDATAAAAVDAARARLAEAEADLEAVRTGAPRGAPRRDDTADALLAQRTDAQAALLALDTTDPLPVRLALEQVREGEHIELVPSAEANALADEVLGLEVEIAKLGSSAPIDPQRDHDERALARRRVDVAETAVAELEAAARRPVFDPADVAELEAAHLEVMELRDATGKRFGGARAARRLHEVEAIEQAVLERMGLLSYTEFLMGGGGSATAPGDESVAERLEAARADLEKAEHQLRQREADVVGELARAELLDRRRQLRAAAEAIIGHDPGDDLEGALRRHRVPGTDTGEHLHRLRQALEGAGLALADEDVEEGLLTDLARVWLREQGETEAQRAALEQQIATIDVQLAAAEAREAAPALDEPLAVAAGAVEDARVALDAAEGRLRRDDETVGEIEQLRAALATADDREGAAAAALAAAEDAVRSAASVVRSCSDALRVAEGALASAEAVEAAAAKAAATVQERLAVARSAGREGIEAEVAAAAEAIALASAGLADATAAADRARSALGDAAEHAAGPATDHVTAEAEDVEWYLLARLAAQRSVSYAGSVPLVLDDALTALDPEAIRDVLDRLERMASTVQVIVVTEDLTAAAWAESLGEQRAQVTEAGAA